MAACRCALDRGSHPLARHYNNNMGYGLELGQVVPLLVRVIVVVGVIAVVCVTVSVGVFAGIGKLVAVGVLLLLSMGELVFS